MQGAKAARALAAVHSVPFTRSDNFLAEMVKTDAHMGRSDSVCSTRSRGLQNARHGGIERERKKIGKEVQLENIKERERSKKDMEERLEELKRSAFLSSFTIVSSLIFLVIVKRTRYFCITCKRMTTVAL